MNQMSHEEAVATLRKLGFSAREIDRLQKLRKGYAKQHEMDQACLDLRYLQFVRWLVMYPRMNDGGLSLLLRTHLSVSRWATERDDRAHDTAPCNIFRSVEVSIGSVPT